jgi:uroporphyrinogen decarboxylase
MRVKPGCNAWRLIMAWIRAGRANVPENIAVLQGQLDPAVLRAGGAMLDAEIDRLLSAWAGRPYVFNLGHGIHLDTPPENVTRLIERVRSFKA